MAVNKPVKKGTNQRVSQAKGLSANVGKYKDAKTLNLKKSQLGASGRKAAASDKIAISRTRYDGTTKKVLGPMGKPITGRVDMGGGNIAVYKNGVRVKASSAKPSGGGGGGGGNGGGGGGGGASGNGKGTPMRPVPNRGTPMRPVPAAPTKKPPGKGTPMRPVKPSGTVQMQNRAGGGRGFGMAAMGGQGKGKQMRSQTPRTGTSTKAEVAGYLAGAALLPLAGIGGLGVGTAATAARLGMAGRAALAARGATAARAALPKAMTRATPTGAARAKEISAAASKAGVKVKPSTKAPTKPPFVANSSRNTGRAGEIERGLKSQLAKPSLTAAQKGARTRASNAAKKKAG